MKTLRINALGQVMSEHVGIWTALPQKRVCFETLRTKTAFEIQCARICGLQLTVSFSGQAMWRGTPHQMRLFNMNMQLRALINLVKGL